MFGSEALEVGIGMALLFLFMSLIATSAKEGLEGIIQKRGKDLEKGIAEFLDRAKDAKPEELADDLVGRFYNHPLISSLYPGTYKPGSRTLPSYIPAGSFSVALLDLVAAGRQDAQGAWKTDDLRKALPTLGNQKVEKLVLAALDTGRDDLDRVKATIEAAYDATMDRVSGWYRRRTQLVLFGMGLVAAVGMNVDAITVARRLADDGPFRKGIIAQLENGEIKPDGKDAPDALRADLRALRYPIGWKDGWPEPQKHLLWCRSPANDCLHSRKVERSGRDTKWTVGLSFWPAFQLIAGWFITALAVMLGAPFWFDVLNKFMVIRSTVKPREKSGEEGSEDRPLSSGKDSKLTIAVQGPDGAAQQEG